MRQTFYPPLTRDECDHGEPRGRLTSAGEPRCALCRAEARRRPTFDPDAVDAAALAARDDLWDDEPDTPTSQALAAPGALTLAALFADDSGQRVARMLDRWQEPQPAGMLF
jgi:hypothetical protein